jgi:hypothetical protein
LGTGVAGFLVVLGGVFLGDEDGVGISPFCPGLQLVTVNPRPSKDATNRRLLFMGLTFLQILEKISY